MTTSQPSSRFPMFDVLRGICLSSMVLYHAMYDIVHILGFPVSWYDSWQGDLWQKSIAFTFILLSGFCWSFSRKPLLHGGFLLAISFGLTAATLLFMPSEKILWGVLFLLGASGLLLIPLQPVLKKIPPAAGVLCSLFLFFILFGVPWGYLGFENQPLWFLPSELYHSPWFAWLGLPNPTFYSADYFPLIPYFFLYLAGYFLNPLFFSFPKSEKLASFSLPFFSFLGRKSLWIYLIHQPILLGIFFAFAIF